LIRIILISAIALALALPASGGAGTSRTAGNSQTYEDSTGELPDGPDITSVTVSNDDKGKLTIQVAIPDRPAMTADMAVLVYLNTDQNLTTGPDGYDGADYVIGYSDGQADLGRWTGSEFDFGVPQTSLVSGYANGVATLKISTADLGGPKAFDFWVSTFQGDWHTAPRDYGPDVGHGDWTYAVSIAAPAKTPPAKKPAKPKAKPKPKKKSGR
jgi:hypothetical protein